MKKALFIRTGSWPPANDSVYRALQKQFPDYTIDLVELRRLIKRRPGLVAINCLFIAWYYGFDILRKRRKIKDCFFRTPFMFHAIRRLMEQRIAQQPYEFTFQMQSMFYAGHKDVPHFLYTDHTHLANMYYPDFDKKKLYARDWIALEKMIYHATTLNFTRSTNIVRSIEQQYDCPPDKTICVYAGSNTEQTVVPFNDAKYQSKNIVFVGIDWERKGGPELLAAFKQVLTHHPDARLTIVGCTPPVDLPQCRVVGRVPLAQVSGYYEEAAIFCLPTKIEPFGIVFVEAMSHKLPLVATNVGAVPDFIMNGETGYMTEPNDVAGLADALKRLLDDPQRCRAMGQRAYLLAQERYSWENVGAAMREHMLAAVAAR